MDEQLQLQIVQLVLAAMSGNQQAAQQIQQIMQAAQQGDQQAAQIALLILAVAQLLQGQLTQMARQGAKLNYIKRLRGICPEGTEMRYFKQGGRVCSTCVAKQAAAYNMPDDPIEAFKCGRKMRKASDGMKSKKLPSMNMYPKSDKGVDIDAVDWEGESGGYNPPKPKKPLLKKPVKRPVQKSKGPNIDAVDWEGESGGYQPNRKITNKKTNKLGK